LFGRVFCLAIIRFFCDVLHTEHTDSSVDRFRTFRFFYAQYSSVCSQILYGLGFKFCP
jgi:hypothetical protein